MRELPAIHVAPVDDLLRPAVLRLRVHPDQSDFVGPVAAALADAEHCPGSEPMAILLGDVPIGFYRIERSARSIAERDFGADAFGLRSFFIDADRQGRGFGALALAAMLADLTRRHPTARLLVLTVNCRNHAALALYRRGGFEDGGGLYHGGRAGPQHLLLRRLPAPS
jgi:GNAT superfamily N-acetyltransferase